MFRTIAWTLRARMVVGVVAAMAVGSAAYGFTAANVVPATTAGDGAGAVSGYTVSLVHYVLTGTNVTGVNFTIKDGSSNPIPNGGTLNATITVSASPVNLVCPAPNGVTTAFVCTVGAQPVANVTSLNVTAAQ